MLLGIHIHNFGVLHDTTIGVSFSELAGLTARQADDLFDPALSPVPDGRLPLGPLNVLIGRNSTGKSALFESLSFISDCLRHDVAYACSQKQRQGFTELKTAGDQSNICFSLVFSGESAESFLNYDLCLSSDKHGRPFVASEAVRQAWFNGNGFSTETLLELAQGRGVVRENGDLRAAAVTETKAPALAAYGLLQGHPALNRIYGQIIRWYFDRLSEPAAAPPRPAPVREGGHRHVSATGDNVRNVLDYLQAENPELYERAIGRIAERMPNEKRIDQAFSNGVSSGTRKLFTLLLLLEDPSPRPLLCLEEPDAGLYHDMVDSLAFALRDYTIRNPESQVMFTTHSPYILESMQADEVWVFERKPASAVAAAAAAAAGAPEPPVTRHSPGTRSTGSSAADPYTHTRCLARDPLVRAMQAQGVGLGAMWYSGHLDRPWDEIHSSGSSD